MKFLAAIAIAVSSFTAAHANQLVRQHATVKDTTVWGLPVTNVLVKRNADLMTVGMDMKLGDYKLKGDMVSIFIPVLINGRDSLQFDPVGLYSRIRYIQYLRDGHDALGGEKETSFRYSRRPDSMELLQSVAYADWMNGATLYLRRCDYGCCHTLVDEDLVPLARWYETTYSPAYHYVTPEAEKVKMRELRGRAYIDFPVNMTDI